MVWIHGGHFEQGSGNGPLYDGTYLTNQTGVVVVTINYRLGALGWLAVPGSSDIPGNAGLLDQIAALQWVQANIAAFGGNPDDVTIFGQSAGGTSVASLMTSPTVKGLFHRVIMESNPLGLPLQDKQSADKLSTKFAKALGCDISNFTCFKAATPEEILTAQKTAGKIINLESLLQIFYPWVPFVDNTLLVEEPAKLLLEGKGPDMELVVGSVQEEGLMFIQQGFGNTSLTDVEYDILILGIFGLTDGTKVLEKYPSVEAKGTDVNNKMLSKLATEYLFACPARAVARGQSTVNPGSFLYRFNHSFTFTGVWGPDYQYCVGHVCHAEELLYVFNDADNDFGVDFNELEVGLADQMAGFWGAFATSGAPASNATWPAIQDDTESVFLFMPPDSGARPALDEDICDFWDSIGWFN